MVSADRFPCIAEMHLALLEDPCAHLDVYTWVEQVRLQDPVLRQLGQPQTIDLHYPDITGPVRVLADCLCIEIRFSLRYCGQKIGVDSVPRSDIVPTGICRDPPPQDDEKHRHRESKFRSTVRQLQHQDNIERDTSGQTDRSSQRTANLLTAATDGVVPLEHETAGGLVVGGGAIPTANELRRRHEGGESLRTETRALNVRLGATTVGSRKVSHEVRGGGVLLSGHFVSPCDVL